MRAITPYYPAGAPGIGLVLLRLAVADSLVTTTAPGAAALVQVGVAVLALGIGSGFQTRLLAALSLLISLGYVSWGSIPGLVADLPSVLGCAALALAGPGAFSIDARLFGSRTVILSKSGDRSSS
jgi:hypothetical protein